MKNSITVSALALSLAFGSASAAPSHLESPTIYENVTNGGPWGQTFVAEDLFVLGARWYIGDPAQPDRSDVNELAGVADLVLFDVSDISNPHELARTQVQDAGGSAFGLSTFLFTFPVSTTIGSSYFIAIAANDAFGLGLVSLSSTYVGGGRSLLRRRCNSISRRARYVFRSAFRGAGRPVGSIPVVRNRRIVVLDSKT